MAKKRKLTQEELNAIVTQDLGEVMPAPATQADVEAVGEGTEKTGTGIINLTRLSQFRQKLTFAASALTGKLNLTTQVNGTLPVANGGTNSSTLTENAVLAGNGTSAIKNIASASGALYSTGAGVLPQFGTLPVAQGGTGGSYSDFAALSDAIGSGGNWVDVSSKLQSGITMNSGFTFNSANGYVYENRILALSVSYKTTNALSSGVTKYPLVFPSWAKPKVNVSFGFREGFTVGDAGDTAVYVISSLAAGTIISHKIFYLLATPYSE